MTKSKSASPDVVRLPETPFEKLPLERKVQLRLDEAMVLFSCSEHFLRELYRKGECGVIIGKRLLFRRAKLEKIFANLEAERAKAVGG